MKNITLDIQGSSDYLNVIGGFIRHAFFFKKKVFKFIGMNASYLDTKEKVNVSTIFGSDLPQTLLLKLNTLDLSSLERYVKDGEVSQVTEEYDCGNFRVVVSNHGKCLMIQIVGEVKILKTSDLKCVLDECEDFAIYESIEARPLDLCLYLRYDCGRFTEQANVNFISLNDSSNFICVQTLNKSDLKFGYTVENSPEAKLCLNLDDCVEIDALKNILDEVFAEIGNSL